MEEHAANNERRVGYRADRERARSVYWLAAAMAALALFQAAPALAHLDLSQAPDWARLALLLSLLQTALAVWMASVPDWSTTWVGMIVCAAVAVAYAVALGAVVVTPRGAPVLFEMDEVRDAARLWCSAIILLTLLLAYACGRASVQWHRRYPLL